MTKFLELLNDEGQEALKRNDVYPSLAKLFNKISPVNEDVIPERQTRIQATNFGSDFVWFHSYLLEGNIENTMKKVANEITKIVEQLKINLKSCLKRFGENPALNSMALFLDTKGYVVNSDVFNHVSSLAVHFYDIIKANGCDTAKHEFETGNFCRVNRRIMYGL